MSSSHYSITKASFSSPSPQLCLSYFLGRKSHISIFNDVLGPLLLPLANLWSMTGGSALLRPAQGSPTPIIVQYLIWTFAEAV